MDVGTVVFVLGSTLINIVIVLLFSFQHLKHPLLRVRNLHLFYVQTFSGIMWSMGSLLTFDHAPSLQTLHRVSCGLSFFSTWVWGSNLFVTCMVVRLQSVYSIFFAPEEQLAAETRMIQRKRLVVAMMGPCTVLGFVLLGGETTGTLLERTDTGCLYSTGIKVCMMVCVWINTLLLLLWLWWSRPRKFKRVPTAVDEYVPTLVSAFIAGPVGIALSALIMSNSWRSVVGRNTITILTTSMVDVVLWSLGGRSLRDALTKKSLREKGAMQTLEVDIGAWEFDQIVKTRAMRVFMYDWIATEGSSWLKSCVPLHTALIRWRQTPGQYMAADIMRRFVDPQSANTVQGIPTHITQALMAVRIRNQPVPKEMFDQLRTWVEEQMENELHRTAFMSPSTAGVRCTSVFIRVLTSCVEILQYCETTRTGRYNAGRGRPTRDE